MQSYKTKSKVKNNHKVLINDVPFDDGQEVEITMSLKNRREEKMMKEYLKGSVLKYDEPFESAITNVQRSIISQKKI